MNAIHNPVVRRVEAGEAALGLIVRVACSGEIARIARASGHDFLFIDTQHAIFSRETVAAIIASALGCGIAPMVRVRGAGDPDTSLFLDAGATGIIVPDVNTADEARSVVKACRFPPLGARSLPGPLIHFDFKAMQAREAMDRANAAILVVCMIETLEGLENVEAIAAVEGVDVLHVGCVDLLLAMGMPEAQGSPEILAAIERVGAAARDHGKILGIGGDRDPQRRARHIRNGARFMTTETDTGLLLAAAKQAVAAIREC